MVLPLGLAPPVVGAVPAEPEPLVPPEDGAVAPEEVVGVGAVVATDELELVVEVVVVTAALAEAPVGTVSWGAPTVSDVAEPDPQAARVRAAAMPTTNADRVGSGLVMAFGTASGAERFHAPAADRAVVEVLLAELIAPVAEPQVLDSPGQLGRGGGQRKQLGYDLELLAGLAIDVRPVRLGLDDHFPARRGRPHPVLLARPHRVAMLPAASGGSRAERVVRGCRAAWIECRPQR